MVFFAFSCANDEVVKEGSEKLKVNKDLETQKIIGIVSPSNPLNLQDVNGVIHNRVLQEVLDNPNLNETNSKIAFALQRYEEKYDVLNLHNNVALEEIRNVLADTTSFYSNTIDNSLHSTVVKNKLHSFFDLIRDSADEDGLTYPIMKQRIVKFENEILSSSLSLSDKKEIMGVTSIARYSFYFWNGKFGDVKDIANVRRPWWKWLVVGVADVAGAVTGNVAGALGAIAGASTLIDWTFPDNPPTP